MLQERKNEKIEFLLVFIVDQRDLVEAKLPVQCPEGVSEGHRAETSAWLLLEQHALCVCLSKERDWAFDQAHAWSMAWSGFQGAWMSVDPFATQLWAALPNVRGPRAHRGVCRHHLRLLQAGRLAGWQQGQVLRWCGGFLQLRQLHQVKISHRKICHGALLDKYYKSCLLKMN